MEWIGAVSVLEDKIIGAVSDGALDVTLDMCRFTRGALLKAEVGNEESQSVFSVGKSSQGTKS
jgi:hypothetical protein